MAVGKRRTRLLVIGQRRFRWRCDFNYPLEQLSPAFASGRITGREKVLVRPEDAPNKLLTVSWSPFQAPVVTPGFVRECIDKAIVQGWLSDQARLEIEL